jgi:hypothetical protein
MQLRAGQPHATAHAGRHLRSETRHSSAVGSRQPEVDASVILYVMPKRRDLPERVPTSTQWSGMVGSQRDDQYTPMGQIRMLGDFASGVRRAKGWKRALGLAVALMILVPLLIGVLLTIAEVASP